MKFLNLKSPIFFIVYSFTYVCINCLGHLYPPFSEPSLFPPPPSLLGKTCSSLFSNFVGEDISDNKKDIAFLLVLDTDSYTERS
jgi:hypothetical protein